MTREKRLTSGPLLEIDIYPVLSDGRRLATRAPKTKPSTEQQAKYNARQAAKKLVRLVNTNFGNTDYFMHPTYRPEKAPQSEQQARRDMVNYLRRVKTKRDAEVKKTEKQLKEVQDAIKTLPNNGYLSASASMLRERLKKLRQPLRYIYVIEQQVYKTGQYAGLVNWHFHLFITGGLDARTMEKMWRPGIRVNCNTYQPETFGPEAAARYMAKDPKGAKRFSYSRNLKKPKPPKIKDGGMTYRRVEQIARDHNDDPEWWERRHKGYRLLRCYARQNPYNGHWYISAVMYRTDAPPPRWEMEGWIDEEAEGWQFTA